MKVFILIKEEKINGWIYVLGVYADHNKVNQVVEEIKQKLDRLNPPWGQPQPDLSADDEEFLSDFERWELRVFEEEVIV